jgi:hypothetical protein
MEWYEAEVVPTIRYFKNSPYFQVIELDANKTIEEVNEELIGKLERIWQ